MSFLRLPSPSHRGLAWLVWLALLLPVAQSAAVWHGYSHVLRSAGSHDDDKRSLPAAHCDQCLAAASVGGGALPGSPPVLPIAPARHERPRGAASIPWLASTTPAYLSRAPPSFSLH